MGRIKSEARRRAEFLEEAGRVYDRLRAWRGAHPEASFDEIGEEVSQERRRLVGRLLAELAAQPEEGGVGEEVCAGCGKVMEEKGKRKRGVSHLEGEGTIERMYHYCSECQSGLFPPRRQAETGAPHLESPND